MSGHVLIASLESGKQYSFSWSYQLTDLVCALWPDLYVLTLCTYQAVHLSAVWGRGVWCHEASWGLHLPSTAVSSRKFSAAADTSPSPQATHHHIAGRTVPARTLHLTVPSGSHSARNKPHVKMYMKWNRLGCKWCHKVKQFQACFGSSD